MAIYLTYLDFELEIGAGDGPDYPVTVVRSPAGEARSVMRRPFGELALEERLKDLQIALLRSGNLRRQIPSPEEATVQRFGNALFDALFTGEVRSRYDVSQELANQQGKGLRLKLRVQPPSLAALPWEFLYDPRGAEYICLSRNTPVVRYLELSQPIQPLAVTTPLRILGMVVSPTDLPLLDVHVEKERVERAVQALRKQGLVELTWLEGNTWRDLQRAMRSGPWHIFHFIGHGGFDHQRDEGLVSLADPDGRAHFFNATDFGRLLADHRSLRLVLLNACEGARGGVNDIFSSTAATLVRRGLAAVVAMQYAITDTAAIEFAQMFYESLVDAMPVDASVAEARKAISFALTHSLEWGTPVLYMRAPDGQIFVVQSTLEQSQPIQDAMEPPDQTQDVTPVERPLLDVAPSKEVASIIVPAFNRSAHAPSAPRPEPKLHLPIQFDWMIIPEGEFLLGSDRLQDTLAHDDEMPQHQLYLPEYRMARTPVTNAQYKRFVDATDYPPPTHWLHGLIPEGKEHHPVVYVSWHDALAFCDWAGVYLPSEAEWEKAARGTRGCIYPWGDDEPNENLCNFDMAIGDTTPVGQYPDGSNPYGLLDMAGNVWEWTISLWGKDGRNPEYGYPYIPTDGRENLAAGNTVLRVLRGGAFFNFDNQVRCAYRYANEPTYRDDNVGFRVVG
ncbi:MAG: SUMF1/EgtB/PvdO family nonheme iron enzyme [Chloroflexi bacterium]|nr:SUMF1/EgtB/PvdO family nonheme iron enzyme [Chloroflexota bacterium]